MPRTVHKQPERQSGISLLDSLVALLILTFTVISIMKLTTGTLETSRHGRRITAANHLAQTKLEEIRGMDYALVTTGSDGPLTETGADAGTGAMYSRAWQVTDDTPVTGTKTVSLVLSWSDKSGAKTVNFQTLVADP